MRTKAEIYKAREITKKTDADQPKNDIHKAPTSWHNK